jgi:hypothetical protein
MVGRWEARRRGFSISALPTVPTRPRRRGSMGPRYYLIIRAKFRHNRLFLQDFFCAADPCVRDTWKRKNWIPIHFKAVWICECFIRRKIRLIESIAKYRYLKKFTCKGPLRQLICPRPRIPYPPPPLHTVYVYTVYIFTQGGGERVETERRREGQQFTKLGRKYKNDWLRPKSINSDKHLPQSLFTSQFLADILLLCLYS